MLARRFTIVCLLVTVFGMSLAMLVAEKSRPARSWAGGGIVTCMMNDNGGCAPFAR